MNKLQILPGFEQTVRQPGMSQPRLMLLRELLQTGEISQADLVRRLGMEGTLVTRFVKQMEGSGLLTRRNDPRDNRFTLVALTPATTHRSTDDSFHPRA